MALSDESLVTAIEGAPKGSLTSVNAQMGLQVSRLVELTQALNKGTKEGVFGSALTLSPLEAPSELDALVTEQIEQTLSWGQFLALRCAVGCF